MSDLPEEEQQERLIGAGDEGAWQSLETTRTQDAQRNRPIRRGGVLAAFRRRRRNEEESIPEGGEEQTGGEDEPCSVESEPLLPAVMLPSATL